MCIKNDQHLSYRQTYLLITSVEKRHSGMYQCTSFKNKSKSVYVSVQGQWSNLDAKDKKKKYIQCPFFCINVFLVFFQKRITFQSSWMKAESFQLGPPPDLVWRPRSPIVLRFSAVTGKPLMERCLSVPLKTGWQITGTSAMPSTVTPPPAPPTSSELIMMHIVFSGVGR